MKSICLNSTTGPLYFLGHNVLTVKVATSGNSDSAHSVVYMHPDKYSLLVLIHFHWLRLFSLFLACPNAELYYMIVCIVFNPKN